MITIRKFTLDDVASTFAYSSDFENTHLMLMVPNKTIEETRNFLAKCIAEYEKENLEYLSFAVCLDGVHIGEVFAYLSEKEVDIGWLIDKRYWGNGYATEAAKLLVEYIRTELHRTDIVAYCDARNIASQKVMKKIGMEFAGSNGIRTYEKDVEAWEEVKYSFGLEIKR